MRREVAIRAILAKTAERAIDQAWIEPTQSRIVGVEPLHHAWSKTFDQDIGLCRQLVQDSVPLWRLQVQAEATFIAVHIAKSRLAFSACRHPRARLGAEGRGRLNLEDICSHVRQDHGTKTAG